LVGQGAIRDCLTRTRVDAEIQAFDHLGLFVTWATVSPEHRDGVEVFLAARLVPKVKRPLPNANSVDVNLPW
jgi:hypothetical protein